MIKSRESLEWICDSLISDRRIPSYFNQYEQMDMQLDDPSTLKIVRRPTNKKAVLEKKRTSVSGVGKTSLSPVRKSTGYNRLNTFGSPSQRLSSPRKTGYENATHDKRKYTSADFTEQGYVSTSPKKSKAMSPSRKKYDGPYDPSLSQENPEYQAKRQQLLNMIQKNIQAKLSNEAVIDKKIDAIRQNAWNTFQMKL